MASLQSLCVYCGSSTGLDPQYREAAAHLGSMMAERSVRLVYGGGRVGLMGVLADAVLAAGGEVIGIIPEHLQTAEVGHAGVTELRIVPNMHLRKYAMFDLADAFIILPGGFGTLDEAFEIITWRQLRLHDRPVVLVNVGGYWDPLLHLIDHLVDAGFGRPDSRKLFTVVDSVEAIFGAVERQPEPAVPDAPHRL